MSVELRSSAYVPYAAPDTFRVFWSEDEEQQNKKQGCRSKLAYKSRARLLKHEFRELKSRSNAKLDSFMVEQAESPGLHFLGGQRS